MTTERRAGNPILPGRGVCDPHVRVFGGTAYLYASHDRSPDGTGYAMDDWQVWKSADLATWTLACTVRPEQTYHRAPCASCWAVDAHGRDGRHFFYFSRGPEEIGVLQGPTPEGPWHDPLGGPLVARGSVATEARDPGVLLDDDGEAYLVFGTWDYFIARLAEDMVTLAEKPRRIEVIRPEGPYGKGRTDDKPYLHRRRGVYYLSWGCYYGMSASVYGPYECRGSVLFEHTVDPALRRGVENLTLDRHGSFFRWQGRWYFACNDFSGSGSPYFRDTCLASVHYLPNGDIGPVRLEKRGVLLPDPGGAGPPSGPRGRAVQ